MFTVGEVPTVQNELETDSKEKQKHKRSEERCKKVDIKVEIGKLFLIVLPNGIYDMYVSSQIWRI